MIRLSPIATAFAPAGPIAEELTRAQATLTQRGIQLTQIMRPFDRQAWPFTGRGFFKLKKQIPKLIDCLPGSHSNDLK